MFRKIIAILIELSKKMKEYDISSYAASIAFFFFLSIVPMLIIICSIIPLTPLTEADLVQAFTDVVPPMVSPLVKSLIADIYDKSAGVMSVAVIATLWSAAKGVWALMKGLNAVTGVQEQRNSIMLRFIAIVYTFVMLIAVILSLFLNVFGTQLVNLILHRIPVLKDAVNIFMHFRFLLVWVILTMVFALIYAYMPNEKRNFKEQIPGAAFTAVVWSIFSWGFSIYVTYGNYYGIYGSLAIITIVLVWLYFCMYIIMIGACLNDFFSPVNQVLVGSRKK